MERCPFCQRRLEETSPGTRLCAYCLLEQGLDRTRANAEDTFGSYEILCQIGEGGMGIAYLAEQARPIRREVALKVLKHGASTPEIVARFETERQALALMDHPNIARVFDAGTSAQQRPYFVMEFVDGLPITSYCDNKSLPVSARLALLVQVCHAVDHAHRKGILHRDLKPSNILVTETDNHAVPKVIDFGIAKATGHLTGQTIHTEATQLIGTVGYMSPEQAGLTGDAPDACTDVYSLGVILYELLCGVLPFDTKRLLENGIAGAARLLANEDVPSLAARLRDQGAAAVEVAERRATDPATLERLLSHELTWMVRRALDREPRLRYPSASALCNDIERYLRKEPVLAGPRSVSYRARKLFHKFRVPIWGVAAALALAIAAVSFRPRERAVRHGVPLTAYAGDETSPTFSPDGSEIAFTWNGEQRNNYDLYRIRIGNPIPQRLTAGPAADYSPAWSPSGRWIAFLRASEDHNPDVMLLSTDAGTERKVASTLMNVNPRESRLTWSRDEQWLILPIKDAPGQRDRIAAISVETGMRHALSAPANAEEDQNPDLSPDGRTLVFVRDRGQASSTIQLLPLGPDGRKAGPESRLVVPGLDHMNFGYPRWISSADLVVAANPRGAFQGRQLWRVAGHGTRKPELLSELGEQITMAVVSRLGGRLAFSRDTFDTNIWSLALNAEGKPAAPARQTIASSRWDQNPALSPDGARVAFESTRTGFSEIWMASSGGADAMPLTRFESSSGSPHWSPDGTRIAFDTARDGQTEIYILPVSGGDPIRITRHPATDILPSWSIDGQWIYFCSNRSGNRELWRVGASGGEPRRITVHGGFDSLPSLDERWIYYIKAPAAVNAIWRVPVGGGAETLVVDGLRPRCFSLTSRGLYFGAGRPAAARTELDFLDFATLQVSHLAAFEAVLRYRLSAQKDDRLILFSQVDREGHDLMLVDNFR